MPYYSIYLINGLIELHLLDREFIADTQGGRLVSTQKGRERAWEAATALAKEKQLPLVDRTQ